MTSILWEKLGLHSPEAGLEPHDGEAPLLSCRPRHSNMIQPQHCLLGQCGHRSTSQSWADPGLALLLLQSTD